MEPHGQARGTLRLRSSPAGLARGAESRPRKPHSSTGKPVVFWGVDEKHEGQLVFRVMYIVHRACYVFRF